MKNNLINANTIKKGDVTMHTKKTNSYGGQIRSYTSKVSEVSTVSEVSNMSKQGKQQSLHSLRPLGEGGRRPDEGADVVRSYTLETAKEVRSTSSCSFAPWGEGDRRSDEGSYQCDKTDMTPHQVRTKLAKRSLSPTILSPSGEELRDVTRCKGLNVLTS